MRLQEIAERLGGKLCGLDAEVERVRPLEAAGPGDLSLCTNLRQQRALKATRATGVLLPERSRQLAEAAPCPAVLVADVRLALARCIGWLHPPATWAAGIQPGAWVEPSAQVAPSARVEAGARVEENAHLGEGTRICSGAVIARGAWVGRDCLIGYRAVVGPGCRLGDRVRIGAGSVVGSDGFGVLLSGGKPQSIPQIGTVVIEDDVEVGANCTIARATLGETRIGRFCRLDDQVHIGHNCRLEEGVVMAAQCGLSGSVHIGQGAVFGGQAGVADHLHIGEGAQIGARAGVATHVPAGARVAGYPAKDVTQWLAELMQLGRLRRRQKNGRTSR